MFTASCSPCLDRHLHPPRTLRFFARSQLHPFIEDFTDAPKPIKGGKGKGGKGKGRGAKKKTKSDLKLEESLARAKRAVHRHASPVAEKDTVVVLHSSGTWRVACIKASKTKGNLRVQVRETEGGEETVMRTGKRSGTTFPNELVREPRPVCSLTLHSFRPRVRL